MNITDFLVCPESSCDNPNIELDYYAQSEDKVFLTFNCTNCIASASEDDFEWYVKCPNCMLEKHEREENEIQHTLSNTGKVTITCTRCDLRCSGHISTKWDSKR